MTGDIASYTYSSVPGAKLALYPARRVYSADTEKYPKGYYLVKTQDTPLVWEDSNSTASNPVWNTAEWHSENEPAYFERIPAGDYLLEEIETPEWADEMKASEFYKICNSRSGGNHDWRSVRS